MDLVNLVGLFISLLISLGIPFSIRLLARPHIVVLGNAGIIEEPKSREFNKCYRIYIQNQQPYNINNLLVFRLRLLKGVVKDKPIFIATPPLKDDRVEFRNAGRNEDYFVHLPQGLRAYSAITLEWVINGLEDESIISIEYLDKSEIESAPFNSTNKLEIVEKEHPVVRVYGKPLIPTTLWAISVTTLFSLGLLWSLNITSIPNDYSIVGSLVVFISSLIFSAFAYNTTLIVGPPVIQGLERLRSEDE